MFDTIRNAWKIVDLRKKLIYTFIMLIIFRLGSTIPVPLINPDMLEQMFTGDNTMFGFIDIVSGGAFKNATIFAMSITPYINSSIIMQLLCVAIPALERLQKEGEEGRKKIGQFMRYGTVVLAIIQAVGLYFLLKSSNAITNPGWQSAIVIITTFTAGTAFLMWLGEQITEKGVGNGISLIIFAGIVSRIPDMAKTLYASVESGALNWLMVAVILVFALLIIAFVVMMNEAERRLPVQYAKRIVGNKQYGGVRQYIPLKMNAANVMPIIFAQALMFIPALFSGTAFAAAFSSMTGFWYNFTLAVLVIAFTYFYTAIIINPQMMADDMKRNGGFIPGVKPGKQTVNYIDTIMTRITLPGSFFLAIVAILPALAMKFLGIQQAFAYFYGGTSLLIMVGVVLDTLKQIESYLLMRHYDGLMKTGRIQGRH